MKTFKMGDKVKYLETVWTVKEFQSDYTYDNGLCSCCHADGWMVLARVGDKGYQEATLKLKQLPLVDKITDQSAQENQP